MKESIGERIKRLRNLAGFTQDELAKKLHVAGQSVWKWESGLVNDIKRVNLIGLSNAFGISLDELIKGSTAESNPGVGDAHIAAKNMRENSSHYGLSLPLLDASFNQDDEVEVPYLREVELSAGAGRCEVIESYEDMIRFPRASLRRAGVHPDKAFCVTMVGNSMYPVFPAGTVIGIDTGHTTIKDGEHYAINHDGNLRIKRLYTMPGGGLRLRSYNEAEWPDECYKLAEKERIIILGRVFWWSVLR